MTVDRADKLFGIKFIFKLLSLLLLLVIVFPLYAVGKTWWSANSSVKSFDFLSSAFSANDHQADVIVVLGAAQLDGKPGPVLEPRLKAALKTYQLGLAPAVMTVGDGAPGDRSTEALSGKRWLVDNGIPKSRVIAISQGRDTYSSTLAYSAAMKALNLESALIVTDPYHCLRAQAMAKDQGISSECSPTLEGITNLENSSFRYLIREAGAYLAYITLGRRGIFISEETINGLFS
jgi:uncharacterized SAM-binding protein YcdF (DUF218 family)